MIRELKCNMYTASSMTKIKVYWNCLHFPVTLRSEKKGWTPLQRIPITTGVKSNFSDFSVIYNTGYVVLLNGYIEENPEYCPALEMWIRYTKNVSQLTLVAIISIENFYESINVFTSMMNSFNGQVHIKK